jgi:hypothetical protein
MATAAVARMRGSGSASSGSAREAASSCAIDESAPIAVQQQRRHEVALVDRLQHVDRVDDALRVGVRELLHQGFDRREIGDVEAQLARLHVARREAVAERLEVAAACPQGHEDPEDRHHEAGDAEPLPVQVEAPRLHQEQQQERAPGFGGAIDRDVDERLRLELDVARQRKEENLARRLVDRVAQRLVEDARERRRPQGSVEQHDHAGRAEADGQDHQGEADAKIAMNLAREPHLDHEADRRHPEADGREERGDRIGAARTLRRLRRHVELLLDDRGADRREADHERDDLQMLGASQELERFGGADALLFLARQRGTGRHTLLADDHAHDEGAEEQERGAREEQVRRADDRGLLRERVAGDAAERRAAADEPEQALRLARVVHDVRERPELADEEHAEDEAGDVEGDRHPGGLREPCEQQPESEQQRRHPDLHDRQAPAPRQSRHRPRVRGHQDADDEARAQQDVGEIVGPELIDEGGTRQRLDGVVRRHRQE